MARYIGRPLIVECVQFNGTVAFWPDQFRAAVVRHVAGGLTDIRTIDGDRPLRVGQFVVHGPGGFSVWHEAIFEQYFRAAEDVPVSLPEPDVRRSARR